ncbi:MAG: hypothetical protein GT600_08100 [Bacteroidales bacterium]|nr:hypothetical protein [Bacteroidales bacterium]HQK70121.1 hypothetical protein [Bacteroidales bacterium]
MPNIETYYVYLDNYETVYEATVHLVIKGYKRICMIAYTNSLIHMTERTRGYE